jgi:peptidyl-tRNA hydrolase
LNRELYAFTVAAQERENMKMYILIKEGLPEGKAIVAAAHASLAAYLKFQDREDVKKWLSGPFRKCICKVNEKEFEKATSFEDSITLTESSLDNMEVAIAFCPREEWPKPFKFYRLWK